MRKAGGLVVSVGMHEQKKSGLATGSCDGSDVIATRGIGSGRVSIRT